MAYEGRTVFARGKSVLVVVIAALLLFTAGALITYRLNGWTWVSISLAAIAVIFGGGGILEGLVERVELRSDSLFVRRLWGTSSIPIGEIERVEHAKGGPPAIRLTNGRWVKLPDVGAHFGNSARGWLKANRGNG